MSLIKFDNTVLDRERKSELRLTEANVLISRGDLTGETLPTTYAEFETFLEKFENIGVNGKDSPDYKDEDMVEDVDYETIVTGVKAQGDITVKKISQAFLEWISDELRNEKVTVFLVPKDPVPHDMCLFIEGVKLTKKLEGKANSDNSPQVVFSYMRRADKITDVYKIFEVPVES